MRLLLTTLTILSTTLGGRIFGGQDASPGQFPFLVSISSPSKGPGQFCAGSIIAQSWILTAAHCLNSVNPGTTVLVGTNSEYSGGTTYHVLKTIKHQDYDDDICRNDIGLIQIDGKFEFSDVVQTVEVSDVEVNVTCVAAGWGTTETEEYPANVRFVELATISLEDCQEISDEYLDGYYLGEEQVCTLAPQGRGTCFGDSGGPLVCDGKLVGVVSYGVLPCAQSFPDVYTRAMHYIEWIRNHIA